MVSFPVPDRIKKIERRLGPDSGHPGLGGFLRYFPFLILLFVLTAAFFPAPARAQKATAYDPNSPVAKVNGVAITAESLERAMEDRLPATGHRSVSDKRLLEIRNEELEKLVVTELLVQEAKKNGITTEPEEVDAEVEKIKAQFPTERAFLKRLGERRLTVDIIRTGIERYILAQKVRYQQVDSKISFADDELKAYYDGHLDLFRMPEQIRLRLLLVAVDPSSRPDSWEEARKKAEMLTGKAREGEDFVEMVKEFSDDAAARERGGDTGLVHEGRLQYPELERVVFTKSVGEVGDPVRTLYGYVVYKVVDLRPVHQLKFEEINKDLLIRELRRSKIKEMAGKWIAGLRKKAEIKYF